MDKARILAELIAERDRLNRAIEALSGDDNLLPKVERAPQPATRERKHHQLSDEAKARVSERMKNYWARRKQGKATEAAK